MAAKGTKGKQSTQRKLTAILCADVVGYSRLMGENEEATLSKSLMPSLKAASNC